MSSLMFMTCDLTVIAEYVVCFRGGMGSSNMGGGQGNMGGGGGGSGSGGGGSMGGKDQGKDFSANQSEEK